MKMLAQRALRLDFEQLRPSTQKKFFCFLGALCSSNWKNILQLICPEEPAQWLNQRKLQPYANHL